MVARAMKLNFNGKQYPARAITLGHEDVIISVTSLENALFAGGENLSPEAERVDDMVFFYVEDDKINLRDEELATEVLENL